MAERGGEPSGSCIWKGLSVGAGGVVVVAAVIRKESSVGPCASADVAPESKSQLEETVKPKVE